MGDWGDAGKDRRGAQAATRRSGPGCRLRGETACAAAVGEVRAVLGQCGVDGKVAASSLGCAVSESSLVLTCACRSTELCHSGWSLGACQALIQIQFLRSGCAM